MSHLGQSRRFGGVRVRSTFPLIATEQRKSRHVSNGPRLGHQLSALIAKSKATRRRLRNFNLVLVTNPHAGYTSAERPVSIGIV
jgi:hypothetical protein